MVESQDTPGADKIHRGYPLRSPAVPALRLAERELEADLLDGSLRPHGSAGGCTIALGHAGRRVLRKPLPE